MRAIALVRAENLPIGELSKRSGVNIETIRYYERIKEPQGRADAAAA
jgi:MerR family mercuric resistance operon transcriptional regulator